MILCARPNPFQKMQEERQENSGAFFAEIEAYVRTRTNKSYAITRHGGMVAAHKVDYRRQAFAG